MVFGPCHQDVRSLSVLEPAGATFTTAGTTGVAGMALAVFIDIFTSVDWAASVGRIALGLASSASNNSGCALAAGTATAVVAATMGTTTGGPAGRIAPSFENTFTFRSE